MKKRVNFAKKEKNSIIKKELYVFGFLFIFIVASYFAYVYYAPRNIVSLSGENDLSSLNNSVIIIPDLTPGKGIDTALELQLRYSQNYGLTGIIKNISEVRLGDLLNRTSVFIYHNKAIIIDNSTNSALNLLVKSYFSSKRIGYSEKKVSDVNVNNLISAFSDVCVDTDSGINYSLNGSAILADISYNDICIDSSILNESYCLDNIVSYSPYNCSTEYKTCSNGSCIFSCSSNWSCINSTGCVNNVQNLSCVDTNNCPLRNDGIFYPAKPLNQTCSSCVPNWTAVNTTCLSTETLTTYYSDVNNCNSLSGKPANITGYCDYGDNRLIGNSSSIVVENLNLSVVIADSTNLTRNFNSTRTVSLSEEGVSRVQFNYNFSEQPLNLNGVIIKKQSSNSSFGYIIVQGLTITKSVTIDRKTSSTSVCVKNSYVNSISEFSNLCNSVGEYLISCPGNNSFLVCSIGIDNKFVISGLTSSAVKEMPGDSYIPPINCTANWSCNSWSGCSNGLRTRSCTDSRRCNLTTGRPAVQEACFDEPPVSGCTPNWVCGNWTKCSKNGTQTNECIDASSCGVSDGKPATSRTCKYSTFPWMSVLIGGLIFLILVVVGIIVYVLIKKRNQATPQKTPFIENKLTPPTPPAIPMPQNQGQAPGLGYPYSRPNLGWQQPRRV